MVVKFYDNDFGRPMLAALGRLWDWINMNNAHLAGRGDYLTIPQMYQKLLKCGALKSLLLRLFILEDLCCDVEYHTRGLYHWKPWVEEKVGFDNPSDLGPPNNYLSVEVTLYEKRKDIPDLEWANGECAYLELETGGVGIF